MTKKTEAELRRILTTCKYNKPSAILPSGEDGEDAIKMNVVIPHSEIARDTVPVDFFGDKRLHIEFTLRASDKWDTLPGVDEVEEILECESDVTGFKWLKSGYGFSFRVSCDVIDDNTALRQYAKHVGSCRLTLLGDIEPKVKKEDSTATIVSKARPMNGQKELPLPRLSVAETPSVHIVKKGEIVNPDEYMVPSKTKGCSAVVTVGSFKEGSYHPSGQVHYLDENGKKAYDDWGYPKIKDAPCVSASLAVQAMIGRMIDLALQSNACAGFLKDLRKELKRLEDGGEPMPMPE